MHVTTHLINNRAYTSHFPLIEEYDFHPSKNYLFDLSYLTLINVTGEKTASFLQGQLSCDVHAVTQSVFQQGALCSLQGRILALLKVIYWQQYQLILPSDLSEATVKSLSRAAALSRVSLEQNTSPFRCYGLMVANDKDLLPEKITLPQETFSVIQTDNIFCACLGKDQQGRALYFLLQQTDLQNTWIEQFSQNKQFRGSLAWHHHLLAQKQVEIYFNTRGLFLPHRLDLDRLDYINFHKGCYKGQEIIARTHYKARRKHELYCWTIQANEPLQAGQNLLDPNGISAGELVDYSPSEADNFRVVVSMKLDYPTQLRLENQTRPIELPRQ